VSGEYHKVVQAKDNPGPHIFDRDGSRTGAGLGGAKDCSICGQAAGTFIKNAYPCGTQEFAYCLNTNCLYSGYMPIETWNSRPLEDALQKRIEELKKDREMFRRTVKEQNRETVIF
jgi:hypothetical protein